MELALVILNVSLCGFDAALSHNVYGFRKVGTRLDKMMDNMSKEHQGMIQFLNRINKA